MSQPITPDAIFELTEVFSPSLSPDGTLLAFIEGTVDREAGKYRTRVMITALPDTDPRAFTSGPSDSTPRFSPGGDELSFLRPDSEGRTQVWFIPVDGGEPRQATSLPGGASDPAWSPDSKHIAFTSRVDREEPHDPNMDGAPLVKEVHRIRWRNDAFDHVFVVDLASGDTLQLTDGDGDDSAPAWSPDGSSIALIAERRADRDTTHFSDVWVVSKDGGHPEVRSDGLSAVGAVAWSPDGASLVAIGDEDPRMEDPRQWGLYVLEPDRPPRPLTDGTTVPSLPAPALRWTDDGRILFQGDSKGESFVCQVPPTGGPVQPIAGGGVEMEWMAIDAENHTAAIRVLPPSSLSNVSTVDLGTGETSRVTNYNDAYFTEHPPGQMQKFTIRRSGFDVESRLILPPDFDESQRYPLVLDIHGGPQGRFTDAFRLDHQVLATAGYLVLGVNPRGSSSYGDDFAEAVFQDWGGEDYRDIMVAVDEVCGRDYVDETRLGVGGFSYGGYMSAWIVGHETRFKAAVVGAPCIDLVSLYGTSDAGVSFGDPHFGGPASENMEAFIERSPLTYAGAVETPVLLMHGEADTSCPIGQSEEYFVALKRLGKTVEFVRFPGCNHFFRTSGAPQMRQEYLERSRAWFDKYLR